MPWQRMGLCNCQVRCRQLLMAVKTARVNDSTLMHIKRFKDRARAKKWSLTL